VITHKDTKEPYTSDIVRTWLQLLNNNRYQAKIWAYPVNMRNNFLKMQ